MEAKNQLVEIIETLNEIQEKLKLINPYIDNLAEGHNESEDEVERIVKNAGLKNPDH